MFVVGLTGGVGSGKTEAARMLSEITGAKLFLADELGHQMMKQGTECFQRIVETFGEEIVAESGEIDRGKLAEYVFANTVMLEKLNGIIHPAVLGFLGKYCEEHRTEHGIMVIESAIMFESGCDKLCDVVWYIRVPEELRVKRLQAGRGYSEEKCRAVIKKQMSEEEYRFRCDKVILNDGDFSLLRKRLAAEVEKIVEK